MIRIFLKISPIKKQEKYSQVKNKVSFINYQMKDFDNSPKL